jgi:hypothetical protein
MKKLSLFGVLLMSLFTVFSNAEALEIRKGFSKFEIEAVENLNLEKNVEKVWNIKYEGSENGVKVMKRVTSDGTAYVVNSQFFEVTYLSSAKGFGTRTVKKSWSTVPAQINMAVLNADELKKQQIITKSKVDDEMALGLIASYLPDLLNENYLHLLN